MAQRIAEAPIVNAWSTKSTVPFFRVGNYAPVFDELTTFDLPVEGAIPPELNGWYLRNGPNPRHDTPHWFTGDGTWILGRSATGSREADLSVFAKLFEDRLKWRLEAETFSRR